MHPSCTKNIVYQDQASESSQALVHLQSSFLHRNYSVLVLVYNYVIVTVKFFFSMELYSQVCLNARCRTSPHRRP